MPMPVVEVSAEPVPSNIVVLSEGKIVQDGTFAELSAAPGMFADFARRQLLDQE